MAAEKRGLLYGEVAFRECGTIFSEIEADEMLASLELA